jgi:hypothetical protein
LNENKSKPLKEFEKKLSMQRKQHSENLIKEKLDQKKLDYDTIALILEVFDKSKFQWHKEHFDVFDSKPDSFRGKILPKNNRECVMLGVRLGTMRSKIIYNLRDMSLSETQRQDIDDLIWNFVWYSWQEARMIHDYVSQEYRDSVF